MRGRAVQRIGDRKGENGARYGENEGESSSVYRG